ncbi:MAG: type II restriction endonuclease [Candidatus Saccharicenans sp.]
MKLEPYREVYKLKESAAVKNLFFNTLIETNHDFRFFVDWSKVKANVEKYKIELSILNSLIKHKDFENTLKDILFRYPEVLPCFPLLIAVREQKFNLIDDFMSKNFEFLDYDFTPRKLNEMEINKIVKFVCQTGLKDFFMNLSTASLQDYLMGIEVGLDTNARKNRSGKVMETLIENLIQKCLDQLKIRKLIKQKNFFVLEKMEISVPKELKNRKADFILLKEPSKVINIEANFYNVTGSKPQEIVDSYINRQEELKKAGFHFIWVTDGYAWKKGQNQLNKAFDKIDYLLNTKFVRDGLLIKILEEI